MGSGAPSSLRIHPEIVGGGGGNFPTERTKLTHPTKHDVKTAALSIQPYALHTFRYSSVNIRSMVTVVAYRT